MGHQRIRPSAPGVAEALLWDLVHVARCFDLRRVRGSLTASLEAALHAVADPAAASEAVAIDGVSVFMRLVDERRGHDLPDAVADTLIAAAQDIVSALDD